MLGWLGLNSDSLAGSMVRILRAEDCWLPFETASPLPWLFIPEAMSLTMVLLKPTLLLACQRKKSEGPAFIDLVLGTSWAQAGGKVGLSGSAWALFEAWPKSAANVESWGHLARFNMLIELSRRAGIRWLMITGGRTAWHDAGWLWSSLGRGFEEEGWW